MFIPGLASLSLLPTDQEVQSILPTLLHKSKPAKENIGMTDALRREHKEAILRSAQDLIEEAVGFLQGLIRIPTINPPGFSYVECAQTIGERLEKFGYAVEYIELSADEVAELAPYGEGQPRTNV